MSLYKTQFLVQQGPPHKTRHTETNIKEGEKEYMGRGKSFLNRTPIAYAIRSRIDKWDLIKLQCFYKANDTVNRTKLQQTDWERSLPNIYLIEYKYPIFTKNS